MISLLKQEFVLILMMNTWHKKYKIYGYETFPIESSALGKPRNGPPAPLTSHHVTFFLWGHLKKEVYTTVP